MEEITCTVCLSAIDKKDPNNICTPCGHLFHKACIKPWVEQKLRDPPVPCPTCRHDISLVANLLGLSEERKSYLDEYNSFRNTTSPIENFFPVNSFPGLGVLSSLSNASGILNRQFSSLNSLRSPNFVNANIIPAPRVDSWLPPIVNSLPSNSRLRARPRQEGEPEPSISVSANTPTIIDTMRARESQLNRVTCDIMMANAHLLAQKNLLDDIIQLENN